ncbi:MAG: response regulator [Gloeomargarita sp. SKYG116]|nr:response regulator [Gloeomargarita sp. SKYG116]MDW8400465.1 response regulator [Gloeomargarita sp. SKYGB_i_bin116]
MTGKMQRVLVIDDSIMIRKMVVDLLQDQYQVIEARNGREGLRLAKELRPDVILLDFVMPELDGYATFQLLRKEPLLQKTPVIMMSGLPDEVASKIPQPFEGFEFLEKPFQPEDLRRQIKKALTGEMPVRTSMAGITEVQMLTNKLINIETLLIQGIEGLVQREIVSRLMELDAQGESQENRLVNLETRVERLQSQLDQQTKILLRLVDEMQQLRGLIQGGTYVRT